MQSVFITGTDTGVGKTRVTLAIMHWCRSRGLRVSGMKPVASGSSVTAAGNRNADALLIQAHCSTITAYDLVNPYAMQLPVAPAVAAARDGVNIDLGILEAAYQELAQAADVVIVEGVGGWRIQIDEEQQMADFVARVDLPVILVVGLRLGCINHALLTAEAVRHDGAELIGWIANRIDPDYEEPEESLRLLQREMKAPLLAEFPFNTSMQAGELADLLRGL